jgi:hypothetical protein
MFIGLACALLHPYSGYGYRGGQALAYVYFEDEPDMRIQVEPHATLRATPRSLYRGERRIDVIEIMDQWYGPGYRYVKVRGHDSSVYILRLDEINDQWELVIFSTAPSNGWQREWHGLARSAQSRQ